MNRSIKMINRLLRESNDKIMCEECDGVYPLKKEGMKKYESYSQHEGVEEAKDDLLVHFDSKSEMAKAMKVVDKAGFTVDDTHGSTMAFVEDELDALEKELDKLFVKNNIKGYEFEAGKL